MFAKDLRYNVSLKAGFIGSLADSYIFKPPTAHSYLNPNNSFSKEQQPSILFDFSNINITLKGNDLD